MVRLYELFPQGPGLVLVFEFMASDLAEVIARRGEEAPPLRENQAKRYTQMLLRGTAYLHGAGIMHRDLKPANLLIRYEGTLVIGLVLVLSITGPCEQER